MNKNRHFCWAIKFKWITDCFGICFILSYDGNNEVVDRLQMRLMLWKMTIIHRNNDWLVDADYWLQSGKNLCFDPLLHEHTKQTADLKP